MCKHRWQQIEQLCHKMFTGDRLMWCHRACVSQEGRWGETWTLPQSLWLWSPLPWLLRPAGADQRACTDSWGATHRRPPLLLRQVSFSRSRPLCPGWNSRRFNESFADVVLRASHAGSERLKHKDLEWTDYPFWIKTQAVLLATLPLIDSVFASRQIPFSDLEAFALIVRSLKTWLNLIMIGKMDWWEKWFVPVVRQSVFNFTISKESVDTTARGRDTACHHTSEIAFYRIILRLSWMHAWKKIKNKK